MRAKELKRLSAGAEERSARAAAGLADLAWANGLLDIAVGSVGSPVGRLTIAVTRRGLVRVAYDDEAVDEVLDRLGRELSPRILESARETEGWRRELEEFFEGRRTRFDLPVDRRLIRGVQRDVLAATRRVPYGRVATYGEIAVRIGRPRAARAVGRALGANPIPIVIPCHRVIGANGKLIGYAGGIDRKVALLSLEGALPTG
ncbi:MAG: methylated-DNA--[protein]-cysteine S-methyltransferase [Actinobacteria bacterium]|nr:methylated-DNA--[protein]-cysteine S-methyltransferase [Actinomycetota bacterium]